MINCKLFAFTIILPLLHTLEIGPIIELHQQNFQQNTGQDVDSFLSSGDHKDKWIIFFKIPSCGHCRKSMEDFNKFHYQYVKLVWEKKKNIHDNIRVGVIDCQVNQMLCFKFNIEKYPTYYLIDEKRQICDYLGKRDMNSLIQFLEEIKKDNKTQCQSKGTISFYSTILFILKPIIDLSSSNTVFFGLLFMIVPFLFGFLASRKPKKQILTNENIPQNEQQLKKQI